MFFGPIRWPLSALGWVLAFAVAAAPTAHSWAAPLALKPLPEGETEVVKEFAEAYLLFKANCPSEGLDRRMEAQTKPAILAQNPQLVDPHAHSGGSGATEESAILSTGPPPSTLEFAGPTQKPISPNNPVRQAADRLSRH